MKYLINTYTQNEFVLETLTAPNSCMNAHRNNKEKLLKIWFEGSALALTSPTNSLVQNGRKTP